MHPDISVQVVTSIIEALCKVQSISKSDLLAAVPSNCHGQFALDDEVDWHSVIELMEWADVTYNVDWKKVGAEFNILSKMPRVKKMLQHCATMKFAYCLAVKWIEQSCHQVLKTVKFETSSNNVIYYSMDIVEGFKHCKPLIQFTAGLLESLPVKLFSIAPAAIELNYTKHGVNFIITMAENLSPWAWLSLRFKAVFTIQSLFQELEISQTEINEKNRLLLAKSDELKSLIENSPDGVLIVQQNVIVYVNQRMLQYLKYNSRADLIGRTIFEKIIPPESVEFAKAQMEKLNSNERLISPLMEFETLTRIPGERFSCETTAVPVTYNGVKSMAVTFRDLSDRKKLQAHMMTTDRMVALGQLAAGVGHEINNPLCYVMMNIELLIDQLKENKVAIYDKQVSTIQKGLERIKTVVGDLKTVSRGTTDEAVTHVDINSVIESVLSMAQNEIQHRAILKYSPTITEPIWIDETRLAQVLLNIIINAAHSIPVGHADLNVIEVKTYTNESDHVVAEIKDSGCGMSEDVRKRIFEPFYTTKPMGSGTGLGLAICQSIVNQFHGAMTVESSEGKGTVFRVSFPAATEKISELFTDAPSEIIPESLGQVMLIDDDEELLEVLQEVVSIRHDCVGFINARAALDVLKDNKTFDCIICDLMMPKMSGLQFHKAIAEHAPYYLNRIIFLTGGSFTAETDIFIKSPDIVYCEKPVDTRALLGAIQKRVAAAKMDLISSLKKAG